MKTILLFLGILLANSIYSQSYKDWNSYKVETFYAKIELDYGTLDENGKRLKFILVPTDMDKGVYKVNIKELNNDVYQIEDSNLYVKFSSITGICPIRGWNGVLEVDSYAWNSKFYIEP
jgi:hypothetical protein|nr:MAG TPA: hypothetical protein [Caudoviricetes sp.]